MYNVDKNIPVAPKGAGGNFNKPKWPFRRMEVGDSFFVPRHQWSKTKGVNGMTALVAQANGRQYPKRFVGRVQDDGYRIWRIQ